ncbi:MAG TPA: PEGA domain-containing protein, partial [Armatimonadetes bacterium]|nr:PEGA domain-containing protein [Armatimonadota bacterium]
ALAQDGRYAVVDQARVEEALQAAHLELPARDADLLGLGPLLRADLIAVGRVESVRLEGEPKKATVSLSVRLLSVSAGGMLSRSRVQATSAPWVDFEGEEQTLVEQAVSRAAQQAARELLGNLALQGVVVGVRDNNVFLSLGERGGLRLGAEVAVIQNGRKIATLRVTRTTPTDSQATVIAQEPGTNISINDRVMVVSNPPAPEAERARAERPAPAAPAKKKKENKLGRILIALAIIAGVYFLLKRGEREGPTRRVSLVNPPDDFTLEVESSGDVPSRLTFNWTPVANVDHYLVTVEETNPAKQLFSLSTTDTALTFPADALPRLKFDTPYTWRVQAVLTSGEVLSSPSRTFTIRTPTTPPSQIRLLGPDNGISYRGFEDPENPGQLLNHPTYSWEPVAGYMGQYILTIATDPEMKNLVFREALADTQDAPTITYLGGVTYYWRIETENGLKSETRSLTVITVDPPVPTAPPTGSEVDSNRPRFSWTPVADIVEYIVSLATDPDFTNLIFEGSTPNATLVYPGAPQAPALELGVRYYWRVGVRQAGNIPPIFGPAANFIKTAPQSGSIEVTSNPSGARIFLDGRDTGLVTPNTLTEVAANQPHTLTLTRIGYDIFSQDNIFVQPGETLRIDAQLPSLTGPTGTLILDSRPTGARVFINGQDMQQVTPATFVLPAGTYQVVVITQDSRTGEKLIALAAGETRRESISVGEAVGNGGITRNVEVVRAFAGDGQVTLSWTPVRDAAKYRIYRRVSWSDESRAFYPRFRFHHRFPRASLRWRQAEDEQLGFTLVQEVDATVLSFVDTQLTNGIAYDYKVTFVDAAGQESSLEMAPLASATPLSLVPPPTPTGLQTFAGDGQVLLVWEPSTATDVLGYKIYRSTAERGNYEPLRAKDTGEVIIIPRRINTFTDSNETTLQGIVNGTLYFYRISAVQITVPGQDPAGGLESPFSDPPVTGFPQSIIDPDLPQPVIPQNGRSVDTSVPLFTWTTVKFATEYTFQLALDSEFTNLQAVQRTTDTMLVYNPATLPQNPPEVFANALQDGVTYYWRVGVRLIEGAELNFGAGAMFTKVADASGLLKVDSSPRGASIFIIRTDPATGQPSLPMDTGRQTPNILTLPGGTYEVLLRVPGYVDLTLPNINVPVGGITEITAAQATLTPVITALATPTGLLVTPELDRNVLQWNPNPDLNPLNPVDGYLIFRRESTAEGEYTQIKDFIPAAKNTAVDTNVRAGIRYFYKIKAVRLSEPGGPVVVESDFSAAAQGIPGQLTIQIFSPQVNQLFGSVPDDPAAPTEYLSTIEFAWSAVANATRYIFEIGRTPEMDVLIEGGNDIIPISPQPSTIRTLHFGVYPYTHQLFWRVTALDDENQVLNQTETRRFFVRVLGLPGPTEPPNVQVEEATAEAVTLVWDPNPDMPITYYVSVAGEVLSRTVSVSQEIIRYWIWRAEGQADHPRVLVGTLDGTPYSPPRRRFTDTNIQSGQTYFYWVQAENVIGIRSPLAEETPPQLQVTVP